MTLRAINQSAEVQHIKRRFWFNSALVAVTIFVLGLLYQFFYGDPVNIYTFSKTLAGTGGLLIAISFALSSFSYYFNFLDSKLGYRKYLGLIGYYFALTYSLSLVWLYPEQYAWGLFARLDEPEVILGLSAMLILTFMAIISNAKIMMKMGTKLWRQCFRLGYIAMLLFVCRAYLLEKEIWHDWWFNLNGLPPIRLVLSFMVIAVLLFRLSMTIHKIYSKIKKISPVAGSPGRIKLWLLLVILFVSAAAYLAYYFLTIRLVIKPVLAPVSNLSAEVQHYGEAGEVKSDSPATKLQSDSELSFLSLPAGFVVQIFASDLSASAISRPGPGTGPRLMTVMNEEIFVAVPGQGSILVLRDTTGDGRADWQQEFMAGLKRPHNIVKHEDWYYIATEDAVIRVRDADNDFKADYGSRQNLVSLPTGGHWTRTVKIINGQMYISVGSSCNVCQENNAMRAAITRCNLDGTACTTFASGLRNTVDFMEYQGKIYGTDNGRDQLGNDLPPEEINLIEAGGDYGWPICYGQRIHDTNFDKLIYVRDPCVTTQAPLVEMPAHIAPLGLDFYLGNEFPADYQGDLFVASHGSWNRQPPDGYKIYRIDLVSKEVTDFITGWLNGVTVHGRPVGVVNYKGGLLISDDAAGLIYYVRYAP